MAVAQVNSSSATGIWGPTPTAEASVISVSQSEITACCEPVLASPEMVCRSVEIWFIADWPKSIHHDRTPGLSPRAAVGAGGVVAAGGGAVDGEDSGSWLTEFLPESPGGDEAMAVTATRATAMAHTRATIPLRRYRPVGPYTDGTDDCGETFMTSGR